MEVLVSNNPILWMYFRSTMTRMGHVPQRCESSSDLRSVAERIDGHSRVFIDSGVVMVNIPEVVTEVKSRSKDCRLIGLTSTQTTPEVMGLLEKEGITELIKVTSWAGMIESVKGEHHS